MVRTNVDARGEQACDRRSLENRRTGTEANTMPPQLPLSLRIDRNDQTRYPANRLQHEYDHDL